MPTIFKNITLGSDLVVTNATVNSSGVIVVIKVITLGDIVEVHEISGGVYHNIKSTVAGP